MDVKRKKVAFIGTGGAAKGLVHLGTIKALQEHSIEPDIYIGASAGAIVSALFTQHFTVEQVIDWMRAPWRRKDKKGALKGRHFIGLPSLDDVSEPGYLLSGLLSIDRFERFMAERLPVNDFRQLDKTLLITATDIDRAERVVFGRGHYDDIPISKAVAASCCIPLLFRPYAIGDRFFMDGEVVRTLSLDLAVQAGAEVVVISNAYRPSSTRWFEDSVAQRGASAVLRQSLNIILSEKEQRGVDVLHRDYPEVVILQVSPDLGHFPFLRRSHGRHMLTRAYREAMKVLRRAKQEGSFY